MELLCTVIIILCNILVYRKLKRPLNLLSLFSFFWIMMILFAKIRLFDLHQSDDRAFYIMDVGGVFFAVAYLLIYASKVKAFSLNSSIKRYTGVSLRYTITDCSVVNIKLYFTFFIIVASLQILFTVRSLSIMAGGGSLRAIHSAIREKGEDGIIRNQLESILNNIIIQPFIFASIPISLICILGKAKHYKPIFWTTTFLSVAYFLTHAGRILIIDYMVYLFFLIQYFGVTISKKTKRMIKRVVLIGLIGIVAITASRREIVLSYDFLKNSFLREIYDYFAIPIPQLSYWADKLATSGVYTKGIGFFNGLLELPIQVLEKFGLNSDNYYKLVSAINDTELVYTNAAYSDVRYNAFVTIFYFFYADFRFVGVAVGSIVFGTMSALVEKKYENRTFISIAMYLLFSQSIARIFARWQFYRLNYVLSFFFVYLLCKRTAALPFKAKLK